MEIKRDLFPQIKQHLAAPEITLVTGARQVGKTTLLRTLQKELDEDGQLTLYLNLDLESDFRVVSSQDQLLNKLRLKFGGQSGFVFIDEIQRKENAGLFLKGLFDAMPGFKWIISGSGSLELKEKIHESLAGRKRIFQLLPVSFREFVHYRTGYQYDDRLSLFFDVEKEESLRLLNAYMSTGGYPRLVTETNQDALEPLMQEIYSSYVQKDIAYLLKVERPEAFTLMIEWLAANVGRIINWSELAQAAGLSLPTVKKYIWYAQKTFVIHEVRPFYRNRIKEITKAPVIYFNDPGLLNYALGQFGRPPAGSTSGFIFQNMIYLMLYDQLRHKQASINFWRTTDQAEVDFVIKRGNDIIPVEVKYSELKHPKVSRAFRSFCGKYNPVQGFIVNLGFESEQLIDNTKVHFLRYDRLLDGNFVY